MASALSAQVSITNHSRLIVPGINRRNRGQELRIDIPAWLIPIARMDIFQKINKNTDRKIAM